MNSESALNNAVPPPGGQLPASLAGATFPISTGSLCWRPANRVPTATVPEGKPMSGKSCSVNSIPKFQWRRRTTLPLPQNEPQSTAESALKLVRRLFRSTLALLGIAGITLSSQAEPAREFWQQEAALRVHDPSTIVREGNEYWSFSTGMGVKAMHSTNLLDWQVGPPVMPQMPSWVRVVVPDQRGHYWAPDLIRVGGRWFLYYSVSSFGKNTSAIALASTPTLDPKNPAFKWTDEGIVVRSYRTNDFNAIDPAVTLDADQRLWLVFGSYWSGIKLVELDSKTGKRIAPDSPMHSLAWNDHIEAPFIHRQGTNCFLFVNWGQCCKGTNSTYEIRVGRSGQITGPYRDREGKDMMGGGGTLVLGTEGRFIGPGHAGIVNDGTQERFSFHYYDGNNRGRPTLGVRQLSWDKNGWPVIARQP